jgi:hypothetical protein
VRIEEAIEVFGRGFTFTRSFTHPYLFERIGPLWVMRDAPRKRPDYRNEEWLVYGISAGEADAIIQENRRERYSVCAFRTDSEAPEPIKSEFKSLGYRHVGTETFFVHGLAVIPEAECDYLVKRVTDLSTAELLKKASGSRQVRAEDLALDQPTIRQYVALQDGQPIGWVRSIVCGEAGWCSNMFVQAPYRRQGIGKALMSRMLLDDRSQGLTEAVLLASSAGSMLYPTVGYEVIGSLMVFARPRE